MTFEEKNRIIDNVQARIDKWVGRPYMYPSEAILLKEKRYPFKIKVNGVAGIFQGSLNQLVPNYKEIYELISYNSNQAEDELFQYVITNYLTYCFGG